MAAGPTQQRADPGAAGVQVGLWPFVRYFLRLGAAGFGGPTALVGFMLRDLVQKRRWISEADYKLSLALAQIMPGPLAAQTAMAIGYFTHGVVGATLVGLVFVLPSFLMVLAISVFYVHYEGLWWVQALFYGIGPAVIAIIAIASYRLSRSINKRDALLWVIFGALALATALFQTEIGILFVLAGVLLIVVRARPPWLRMGTALMSALPFSFVAPLVVTAPAVAPASTDILLRIVVFFAEASSFVFGSGLAIIPFLHQSVVVDFGWLNERQFLDAVAVAMITPGPVVITVAFIGYLVAGPLGAVAAAIGMFGPTYLFTVVPAPWFKRHRDNRYLKAFVEGTTAAATGAIAGSVFVLACRSQIDVVTVVIALVSLVVLWRFRPPEPYVVLAAGAVGLVAWPLVSAGT